MVTRCCEGPALAQFCSIGPEDPRKPRSCTSKICSSSPPSSSSRVWGVTGSGLWLFDHDEIWRLKYVNICRSLFFLCIMIRYISGRRVTFSCWFGGVWRLPCRRQHLEIALTWNIAAGSTCSQSFAHPRPVFNCVKTWAPKMPGCLIRFPASKWSACWGRGFETLLFPKKALGGFLLGYPPL